MEHIEDTTLEEAKNILEQLEFCLDEEHYRTLRDQLYALKPIELLREELQHPHFRRRMAAATNLGRLGDTESIPELLNLLNDTQPPVREMTLFALGILRDASTTEAIIGALTDYDPNVRYRAVGALADMGYPRIEEILINATQDESYGVRELALSQLRFSGTPQAIIAVLRGLLEREYDMQQLAEQALDRLLPRMGREHYRMVQEQLSLRERRLLMNYLESRNLQEVYGVLYQRLQIAQQKPAPQKSLDKYGRILNAPHERDQLSHAWERDDTVDLLLQHFQEDTRRSILLIGEAGTGKSAIIHEFTRRLIAEDDSWHVLETNTSELMTGTRYLGDWETKLKEMAEVVIKHGKVILYMTNPNDLLGAGAHSKSDENFADFFKPYMQRGEVRIIAECTEDSLKNGLNREPGFLRLFRQIKIQPLDDTQTLSVLQKRLDLLAEAERPVQAEAHCLEQVVDFARSFYTRSDSPGRACDLLDTLIDFVGRKTPKDQDILLKRAHIPECLSEVTGMPLDLLDDQISLDLEATTHWFQQRLIHQDHAIHGFINRLALIKAGLAAPEKPLGITFLVGPTGVGKTYFTKLVAERLFGDPKRMIRFDLSEYQGRFAVEKLVGSPHDKDREGLLTEAVRNQPYCVLLFDEFEKADPEIFSLFLQILDEGRLTDAAGQTTDFRQTLIFLTSNLGASRTSVAPLGFTGQGDSRAYDTKIHKKLEEFFAPEFINRLDDVVVFQPLSPEAMDQLVQLELRKAFDRRGLSRRNIHVQLDPNTRKWLETHGFSPRYGARELHRTIEKHILTPISRLLVAHPDLADQTLSISLENDQIQITRDTPKRPSVHPPELKR